MAFENGLIDLRSDTVTHPTEEMRKAMAMAEVGDDVFEEDPSINKLQDAAAARLGKEAGLFLASGTMANLVAVLTHCQRGDEAIMGTLGHTYLHEVGGISALGGVFACLIPNQANGTLAVEDIRSAYREDDIHHPESRLLILENTQNACGGIPLSKDYMDTAAAQAHELGMAVHVDGARIFNAETATGTKAADLAASADSLMFCLSKGLCAPVGSVLVGRSDFIARARKIRKQLGGGMRQAGILAAAGQIALDKMTLRLGEDHQNARALAEGLRDLPGLRFHKGMPQSNMVFLEVLPSARQNADQIMGSLKSEGILFGYSGPSQFRLVTHYWINSGDIKKVVTAFRRCLS